MASHGIGICGVLDRSIEPDHIESSYNFGDSKSGRGINGKYKRMFFTFWIIHIDDPSILSVGFRSNQLRICLVKSYNSIVAISSPLASWICSMHIGRIVFNL